MTKGETDDVVRAYVWKVDMTVEDKDRGRRKNV